MWVHRERVFLPSTLSNYVGRVIRAFRVLPWERDFLDRFESSDCDAAISVPRGAGKTKLAASIACAVIDPRSSLSGGEVVAVASSFSQARLIFEDVLELLGPTMAKGGIGKFWCVAGSRFGQDCGADAPSVGGSPAVSWRGPYWIPRAQAAPCDRRRAGPVE